MTSLLNIAFAVAFVLLWGGFAILTIRFVLRMKASRKQDEAIPALVWRHNTQLLGLIALLVVAIMVTATNTAYRPKLSPVVANPALDERLKKVDSEKPVVRPSTPDRPAWEEVQKKNRDDNAKAKEEFEKLAPAKAR